MTVAVWGTGRPDYMKAVISSPPVIIDSQLAQVTWLFSTGYTLVAGGTAINDIYTVPSGYNLAFGGGYISVKDSCINNLRIVADNNTLVGDFRYDMRGDFIMSSLTGQVLSAGTVITAYVFNNDAITSIFTLTLTGVLSKE